MSFAGDDPLAALTRTLDFAAAFIQGSVLDGFKIYWQYEGDNAGLEFKSWEAESGRRARQKPVLEPMTDRAKIVAVRLVYQRLVNAYGLLMWKNRIHPFASAHKNFARENAAANMVLHSCIITALVSLRELDTFFGGGGRKQEDDIRFDDFPGFNCKPFLTTRQRQNINKDVAHITRSLIKENRAGNVRTPDRTFNIAAMLKKATPLTKRFLHFWMKQIGTKHSREARNLQQMCGVFALLEETLHETASRERKETQRNV